MAVVDARYKFVMVDIGAFGRESDGGVFSESEFGKQLNTGTLNIPDPRALPGTNTIVPSVFVWDEAFPSKPNLKRPFPGMQLTIVLLPDEYLAPGSSVFQRLNFFFFKC